MKTNGFGFLRCAFGATAAAILLIAAGCSSCPPRNHRGDDPQVAQACDGKCGNSDCEQHRKQCGDCQAGRPHGGGQAECNNTAHTELGSWNTPFEFTFEVTGQTESTLSVDSKNKVHNIRIVDCKPKQAPCPEEKKP